MQTYDEFQWELGEWYEIPEGKRGDDLCSSSWFHCYDHPLLAVLLNPIHANFKNPLLFEVEVDGNLIYGETDGGKRFEAVMGMRGLDFYGGCYEPKIASAIRRACTKAYDASFDKAVSGYAK